MKTLHNGSGYLHAPLNNMHYHLIHQFNHSRYTKYPVHEADDGVSGNERHCWSRGQLPLFASATCIHSDENLSISSATEYIDDTPYLKAFILTHLVFTQTTCSSFH